MKINLVLEVGPETAIVIAALENLATLFNDTSPGVGSPLSAYADTATGLIERINSEVTNPNKLPA
jgi:hypothetical protein